MNCPVCKKAAMANTDLAEGLTAIQCPTCKGIWIPSDNYWRWLQKQGAQPATSSATAADTELPASDSNAGKLCPGCGHFLTRRKVGHGVSFNIDRCTCCGGIWLDSNEWELLKSRNLHHELHKVFSDVWQHRLQQQESLDIRNSRIEAIIGHDDFIKLQSMLTWIQAHPRKQTILGFILENTQP